MGGVVVFGGVGVGEAVGDGVGVATGGSDAGVLPPPDDDELFFLWHPNRKIAATTAAPK